MSENHNNDSQPVDITIIGGAHGPFAFYAGLRGMSVKILDSSISSAAK